jgi:hypothetical protein
MLQVEGKRVAEVERRKTLEEEAKHARARIDYQQALEKKRREEEMHMQVWQNSRFINSFFLLFCRRPYKRNN